MEIYAELSKKTFEKIQNGKVDFSLPNGVELLKHSKGRFLYFECGNEDEDIKEFGNFLDDRGINWQKSYSGETVKNIKNSKDIEGNKKAKQIFYSGFGN